MPVADAGAAARRLLADPHPAVRLAAAAWHSVETDDLRSWLDRLGSPVETGPMPSQAGADAWAADRTGGLIERFPVDVDPLTALVLANAVACDITWRTPLPIIAADQLHLPAAPGFAVGSLLRSDESTGFQGIVDTELGPVGVHALPSAQDDMVVVSVVGPASARSDEVLRAAHPIAVALARDEPPPRRSLFDLPLGPGSAWTITERRSSTRSDEQHYTTALPAWSADSDIPLAATAGFGAAAEALIALLPPVPGGYEVQAKQSAMARYTRTGFRAAAVTGIAMNMAAVLGRESLIRTAELELTRPHAVVAVARAEPGADWSGVPLFSAWITSADEAG